MNKKYVIGDTEKLQYIDDEGKVVYEETMSTDDIFNNGVIEYIKPKDIDYDIINKIIKNHRKNKGIHKIIKIKYHHPDLIRLERIENEKSDWIDLRAAEDTHMEPGDSALISLGVSMQLPEGYEAHVLPRSSTFKNFGILMANSKGIIDNAYCGDNDIWKFSAYCVRTTDIHFNDRIAQFRIVKKQPEIEFKEVNKLTNTDRGGIGTTGIK